MISRDPRDKTTFLDTKRNALYKGTWIHHHHHSWITSREAETYISKLAPQKYRLDSFFFNEELPSYRKTITSKSKEMDDS